MPSDGVQKLDQKTNLHQNRMPTVCVRIFSQKDRIAMQQSFQGVLYRNGMERNNAEFLKLNIYIYT